MVKNQFIVIVGCGRLGSYLANGLSRVGHSVVVVDRRPEAFDLLNAEFSGFKIVGDAVESEVLREARLDQADLLLAVAEEDNVNLMVAQVGREVFGVAQVMARVADPARQVAYREFDIATVCPTTLAGDLLLKTLAGERES